MLSGILVLQATWVAAQPTTTSCPTDCKAGVEDWELGWAQWKKEYCCKHENFGCPTTTTTSCHYDCRAGFNNWRLGWAQSKKAYCCKHEGIACPDANHYDYDCRAGFNNWRLGWAHPKKAYCCKHEGIACPDATTTSCKYDCQAALNNWEAAWAQSKKDWCCKHEGLGCTTTTTRLTCRAAAAAAEGHDGSPRILWTPAQRRWCCNHEGVGCPPTTTLTTFPDCTIPSGGDTSNWSRHKQDWCCKHMGVVCPVFDCTNPTAGSPQDWSAEKRSWCCQHRREGCVAVENIIRTTTTTSSTTTFDCNPATLQSTAWSTPKALWCCKFKGQGCPTTTTPAPTTTTITTTTPAPTTTTTPAATSRSPPTDVMHCALSCLGAPAVSLPGSTGSGKGASVNDVSVEECRRACINTEGCEGIVYTNVTRGTPFNSMCFGRKDIHTSMCQPGGQHFTELIGTYPRGKCALFGDPHIISFDRVYGPPITVLRAGEYHLVKSEPLSIQGRFGYTKRFPTAASTVGIAIGGSMVKGHTLVVVFTGPVSGAEGFKVFWDERRILAEYPSSFASDDGLMAAKYEAMDPQKYHREGRHTIGGEKGLLPSYLFEFTDSSHTPPLFLTLYVLLGPDNVNAVITTWKVVGGQDGFCGNFNCDQVDDGLEALTARGASLPIPAGESLFKHGAAAPSWVMREVTPPSIDDCDPAVKARAEHACRGLPHGGAKACIFDACAAKTAEDAEADAQEDVATLALAGQPTVRVKQAEKPSFTKVRIQEPKPHTDACDTRCTYAGLTKDCRSRTFWGAIHHFAGHHDACMKSHIEVLKTCPVCIDCSLAASGCEERGRDPHVLVKYQEEPLGGLRISFRPNGVVSIALGACVVAVIGALVVIRRRLNCGTVAIVQDTRAEEMPLVPVAA